MAYEIDIQPALEALTDPTRRAVLNSLRTGPKSVSEIASGLPVSRPAVSQHLKRLETANLVQVQKAGTRRIYRIERTGLAPLRQYIEQFWDEVLWAFEEFVDEVNAAEAEERNTSDD